MRYVIVQDGEVVNTILWDGVSQMELPAGMTMFPEPEWTPHPPDTVTSRWVYYTRVVEGVPSVVWEEVQRSPEEIQAETDRAAREASRVAIRAIIDDIKLEQDRVQGVLDHASATPREKDLARAAKRMGAAIIDLARFVQDN